MFAIRVRTFPLFGNSAADQTRACSAHPFKEAINESNTNKIPVAHQIFAFYIIGVSAVTCDFCGAI